MRMGLFALLLPAAMGQIFQTAAIRESVDPDSPATSFTSAGKFTLINQTIKDCARLAYGTEVVRGSAPKWVETQKFDLDVQFTEPATDAQLKSILRGVLENRFKVKAHRDSRMFGVYALVKSKSGLKIDASAPGPGHLDMRPGAIVAQRATMPDLAQALAAALKATVIDQTGLPGVFTFQLTWRPEVVQPGALTTEDDEPNVLPDMPRPPSLFESLEQQLGVKLESRKMKLDVTVLDSAARP